MRRRPGPAERAVPGPIIGCLRVVEAADGEAALAYARRLRPDFVVTEIAIPRLDGIGLLRALALEPAPPCVVVSTDQSDSELLAWMRELGAHEVTAKPLVGRDRDRRTRV